MSAETILAVYATCMSIVLLYGIPDPESYNATVRRLVYYRKPGTFHQVNSLCRQNGGYLVTVNSPEVVEELMFLENMTGGMEKIYTSLIRQDDKKLYHSDAECSPLDEGNFSHWDSPTDSEYSVHIQCVSAEGSTTPENPLSNFRWEKIPCDEKLAFVCVNEVAVDSEADASTLPDKRKQARDPEDCVPDNNTSLPHKLPLRSFIEEGNTRYRCSSSDSTPSTVTETVYVTMTPDVITTHVTLTTSISYSTNPHSPAVVTNTPQTISGDTVLDSTLEMLTLSTEAEDTVGSTLHERTPSSFAELPSQTLSTSESQVGLADLSSLSSTVCFGLTANRTEEEVREELSSVVWDLSVDPANVSRRRRRRESAGDERQSAKTMGATAAAILVLFLLLVVLMDLPILHRDVKRITNACTEKPQTCRKR